MKFLVYTFVTSLRNPRYRTFKGRGSTLIRGPVLWPWSPGALAMFLIHAFMIMIIYITLFGYLIIFMSLVPNVETQRFLNDFLTYVVKLGAKIPRGLGEIIRILVWRWEYGYHINKTINNILTVLYSHYLKIRYEIKLFTSDEIFRWKLTFYWKFILQW